MFSLCPIITLDLVSRLNQPEVYVADRCHIYICMYVYAENLQNS